MLDGFVNITEVDQPPIGRLRTTAASVGKSRAAVVRRSEWRRFPLRATTK
jgi:hypothetical protein